MVTVAFSVSPSVALPVIPAVTTARFDGSLVTISSSPVSSE